MVIDVGAQVRRQSARVHQPRDDVLEIRELLRDAFGGFILRRRRRAAGATGGRPHAGRVVRHGNDAAVGAGRGRRSRTHGRESGVEQPRRHAWRRSRAAPRGSGAGAPS